MGFQKGYTPWNKGLTKATSEILANGAAYKSQYVRFVFPDLMPSLNLAYLLGVMKGDGCISRNIKSHKHILLLTVKDKELAEEFNKVVKGIGLHPNLWQTRRGYYRVEANSKIFYEWYRDLSLRSLQGLLPTESEKAVFLRGYFDSDGGCYPLHGIVATSTNSKLLKFIQNLLLSLQIWASFEKNHLGGTSLRVHSGSCVKFRELIGFVIRRKQMALEQYVDHRLEILSKGYHPRYAKLFRSFAELSAATQ